MNETFIAWFESLFNVTYLVVVWYFVYLMTKYMNTVEPQNRKTAGLVRMAFILLATGDTGHVGFRVLAHLLGGVDTQVTLLGTQMSLIGLGSLATAYTVTLFYMLFVYVWQSRYQQKASWFTNLLLAAGVFRLALHGAAGQQLGQPGSAPTGKSVSQPAADLAGHRHHGSDPIQRLPVQRHPFQMDRLDDRRLLRLLPASDFVRQSLPPGWHVDDSQDLRLPGRRLDCLQGFVATVQIGS